MLIHPCLGYYVVSLIIIPKPFHYLNRSQVLRMANQYFECAQQEGKMGGHDLKITIFAL
jgi:hypothetical protein